MWGGVASAGLLVAQGVEVLCGELAGTLLPGGRRGEEKVRMHSTGLSVSAPDFERAAGRGSTKKWRRSLRVVDMHRAHLNGLCVQDWLVQKVSQDRTPHCLYRAPQGWRAPPGCPAR
jgi:hypothetical protein